MPKKMKNRVKILEKDAKKRVKNFNEVSLGYTEGQAILEAERCLSCKEQKCVTGCPADVNIPEFIRYIKERKFLEAAHEIKKTNSLPAICGRVCPQENLCENTCVLGKKDEPVNISGLERFAADFEMELGELKIPKIKRNRHRVAIIGSGPSGLTCAADLALLGYRVTVLEALHREGGVLSYGIPEFRLPKNIVEAEVDYIKKLGVNFVTSAVVGKTITIDDLFEDGFEAVYIATGAGLPRFMRIPGENLDGVYSANEFLTRSNLMKAYKFPEYDTPIKIGEKVAVVGGGNVAMDSARTALRLGAEKVFLFYRRSEAEMPARRAEVEHAKEEGVIFATLKNPIEIIGNKENKVSKIKYAEIELGPPDSSGRPKPMEKKDENGEAITGTSDIDTVVIAIGQGVNTVCQSTTEGLKTDKRGHILLDKAGKTSLDGVFAGGDVVTGSATVIEAIGAGKEAAKAIREYLQKN